MKYIKAYLTFAAALSLASTLAPAGAEARGPRSRVPATHPKEGASVITNAARNVEKMATR
jgi:hypothetical protein